MVNESKTEQIDFLKHTREWVGFFISEAIGQNDKAWMELRDKENPSIIEAKLILNGLECDVTKTLEYMGNVFDEMVKKEAEKIVKEKVESAFFKKFEALDELVSELKGEVSDYVSQLINR